MNNVSFGRRLNNVRKEKQLTSEALSERCGVNAVFIRQIENASRLPSLTNLVKLCNALEISPAYLLADSLTFNEHDEFNELIKTLRGLSTKEFKMVKAMIESVIDKMEN